MGKGSVTKKERANGLAWIYRFQTTRPSDGKRVENTRTIGLVKEIGSSERDAWREIGRLGLDKNIGSAHGTPTFRELADHFRRYELQKKHGIGVRAEETVGTHELLLNKWILPRWGGTRVSEIKPLVLESWYEALTSEPCSKKNAPLGWGTIVKVRSTMSQIFKHAQRHELISASVDDGGKLTNPVLLSRCESGIRYEAIVVEPEQMIVILRELDTPETQLEWTLALLHAATALRPEESFGLKWFDIGWQKGQINIRRGWSKGKVTSGKTEGSMTQVAMHPALGQALLAWRRQSLFPRESDWVFASTTTKGRTPRSAGITGQNYLRPAAVKAGVIPEGYKGRFGWHNLRHSLATFFASNDVNLPVIQSLLRHAKPSTTAKYLHRDNAAQMAAQAKFLDAINITAAVV